MKAIFSSEIVDSAGHKMIMSGGIFSRFLDNPVLLFVHDDESVPVGIVKNLRIENKQLIGEVVWDENDPEALKVKAKYDNGFMRGFSIRATVKKFHKEIFEGKEIAVIDEWELVEVSCVSVPSNREALVIEKSVSSQSSEGAEVGSPETVIVTFFSNYQKTKTIMNKDIFKKLGIVAVELQTEDEVLKKIGELEIRAVTAEGDIQKKNGEITNLKKEVSDLKEAAEDKAIDDLVDGAVVLKKITAGEAPHFKKLAKDNFDVVKSILDAKQGVQLPSEQIKVEGEESDVLKTYNEHKTKGFEYFWKNEPKVLATLKKSFPDKYAELEKTITLRGV